MFPALAPQQEVVKLTASGESGCNVFRTVDFSNVGSGVSPSEFEELLDRVPFKPLLLTLASGDRVIIRDREVASVEGLSVTIRKGTGRISESVRLVSIPNLVMVEQYDSLFPPTSRRRR